jgi:hypothetical protein
VHPLFPDLNFSPPQRKEETRSEARGSYGGLDPADQGVRVRGARAGDLRLPQLLDELPGRQGPQKVSSAAGEFRPLSSPPRLLLLITPILFLLRDN